MYTWPLCLFGTGRLESTRIRLRYFGGHRDIRKHSEHYQGLGPYIHCGSKEYVHIDTCHIFVVNHHLVMN